MPDVALILPIPHLLVCVKGDRNSFFGWNPYFHVALSWSPAGVCISVAYHASAIMVSSAILQVKYTVKIGYPVAFTGASCSVNGHHVVSLKPVENLAKSKRVFSRRLWTMVRIREIVPIIGSRYMEYSKCQPRDWSLLDEFGVFRPKEWYFSVAMVPLTTINSLGDYSEG